MAFNYKTTAFSASGLAQEAMKKPSLYTSYAIAFVLLAAAMTALVFFVIYPNEFRLQSMVTFRCGSRPSSSSLSSFVEPVTPEPDFRLLIGILSLPDSYERRHLVRDVYALQPDVANARIDVRFVFCNLTKDEQRVLVAMEIMLYDDIIILDCAENMDNGKTYTYFSSLPKMLDGGGRPYDYVMKADDDTYFRLQLLAESLRKLPLEDMYYGLITPCLNWRARDHYMSGMGYILSWDLVEWIATAETPRNHQVGPEDKVMGTWLREARRGKNEINMEPVMYDYLEGEPRTCYRHELVPDTVGVHMLKNNRRWATALKYFNATVGLKPSNLYHMS